MVQQGPSAAYAKEIERLSAKEALLVAVRFLISLFLPFFLLRWVPLFD